MHFQLRAAAVVCLAFALIALGCASTPEANQQPTTAWNQHAVTSLAAQLTSATESAYTAVYQSPELEMEGTQDASDSMAGTLREMHEQSLDLRDTLQKGANMKSTVNQYSDIKELSRDLTEASGFTDLGTSEAGPLSGITSILDQLDAYYGAR